MASAPSVDKLPEPDIYRRNVFLAQERLRARPVADHVHGVLLDGIAGCVEQTRAAVRRALPDPPPLVLVERRRLGRNLVDQLRVSGTDPADGLRPRLLGLARVGVVLTDVGRHGILPDDKWGVAGGSGS